MYDIIELFTNKLHTLVTCTCVPVQLSLSLYVCVRLGEKGWMAGGVGVMVVVVVGVSPSSFFRIR